MKLIFILLPITLLAGCSGGEGPEFNLTMPDGVTSEVMSLVEVGWPKIKAACPGLNKYASDLEFREIEDNFSYASSKDAERVSIVLNVKESSSLVIGGLAISGHNCSFDISRDGFHFSIPKRQCASLCEGKVIEDSEYKKEI